MKYIAQTPLGRAGGQWLLGDQGRLVVEDIRATKPLQMLQEVLVPHLVLHHRVTTFNLKTQLIL